MKLTYKERQDILWALRSLAHSLDAHTGTDALRVEAEQSAKRLRELAVRMGNER
jgi:hypothetical protein